ncbi:hypothetical protein QYF36_019038 [Acer negundo]|nr:hypothetical protein QYF36_019038 [Acer negundo]
MMYKANPINEAVLTISSALQRCTNFNTLKKSHAKIFSYGLQNDTRLLTKLTTLYVSFKRVDDASLVFELIANPCSYLWNILIRGYATEGKFSRSLELYSKMIRKGSRPDKFAFPFVLKSCAGLSDLEMDGRKLRR